MTDKTIELRNLLDIHEGVGAPGSKTAPFCSFMVTKEEAVTFREKSTLVNTHFLYPLSLTDTNSDMIVSAHIDKGEESNEFIIEARYMSNGNVLLTFFIVKPMDGLTHIPNVMTYIVEEFTKLGMTGYLPEKPKLVWVGGNAFYWVESTYALAVQMARRGNLSNIPIQLSYPVLADIDDHDVMNSPTFITLHTVKQLNKLFFDEKEE